ncbi:hypothetical protein J437_LFUL003754 [Ladona fulva]|uniref:C3H1-type domain-containing protein n=1 Tax=Ladona fulva TaxID=123851 RepID=A0A8K0JX44_LADFU|nr:hypothetical protein J437_LFUL003754 [Ladona fulva]
MASLVADYRSGSSSESETDSDSVDEVVLLINFTSKVFLRFRCEGSNTNQSAAKLPHPEFGSSGVTIAKHSVFSNPFVEAERAKKAILEKHVKMTPTKDETTMINGKRICWNYRKGRCRFGHNCKFAHDSDLHLSSQQNNDQVNESGIGLQNISSIQSIVPDVELDFPTECDDNPPPNRKKRPGLSEKLVPGRKVMKIYNQNKAKEVPWVIISKGTS